MKKYCVWLGVLIIPGLSYGFIATAYDNTFYPEVVDPQIIPVGSITGVSDIYYYYNTVDNTMFVKQTEWLSTGGIPPYQEPAPYESSFTYTGVTFDNMCDVYGPFCDDIFLGKVAEMRAQYDDYLSNINTQNKTIENEKKIYTIEKKLSAGIASVSAMSAISVSDVSGGEVSVGAGYGHYNNQSAVAFGAAMGISDNWSINAATGFSNNNLSMRAGTNYKFKLF